MSASLVKPRLRGADPYRAPQRDEPDELMLDLNEGSPLASDDWMAGVAGAVGSDRARRYPDPSALEAKLADRFGIDRECVLATNGGDDAIDRVCRVCMDPGDSIVLPSPTFEMIARSADLVGGEIRRPPWMGGPFPVEQVIDSCDESTRCVAVVSPNNPTGAVIRPDELARLSEAIPRILLMVDLAYTEFAGFDLTQTALDLPNAVMVRTFSKAYGLAGLRIGYAAGPSAVINAMRAAGGPFPCSAVSLAAAEAALDLPDDVISARIDQVRRERASMTSLLRSSGVEVLPSEANFVLARLEHAGRVWERLAERGVRVKRFADPVLDRFLRIGCPGDSRAYKQLIAALNECLTEQGARP